jgi:hypothetical protein
VFAAGAIYTAKSDMVILKTMDCLRSVSVISSSKLSAGCMIWKQALECKKRLSIDSIYWEWENCPFCKTGVVFRKIVLLYRSLLAKIYGFDIIFSVW